MRCSSAVGCAGRLRDGFTASGCARWLTGVGLTGTFAVGLALVRAARRGGAFFAASFLIALVFLTVFLRLAVLVTVVFLRSSRFPGRAASRESSNTITVRSRQRTRS